MTIKSMFAVGVTALCASVFAEPLESANVVGYQTFSATKNTYQLKSVQFDGITTSFNLLNLTGNLTGPSWDEDGDFTATAPILQVRNGNGYDIYYFLADGKFDPESETYSPGWADAGGNPLSADGVEIESGTAFWFVDQYSDTSTLTVPGAVPEDATISLSFNSGYTLAACPYPKAVSFNDIAFSDITGPAWDEDGNFTTTAPILQIRNGNGYDWYYYLSDGQFDAETETYSPGWADAGGNPLPDYNEKLFTTGTAFWVVLPNNSTTVTATFSR